MSARRRDNTPPFDIMGSRPASAQASGRGPRPRSGVGSMIRSITDAWQDSAGEPLTLRVPRGMALALMGGLLGLLILAYWVGYSRGDSAAEKRVTAIYEPAAVEGGRVPPARTGAGDAGPGAGATDGGTEPVSTDARVPGSNYLILALYPPDEAQRLRAFLGERGVDVMIGPRNNKGLCQVIALRGFTGEQIRDTEEDNRYRSKLQALGREWKAANEGRGDDLSSMYYGKYEPPVGR